MQGSSSSLLKPINHSLAQHRNKATGVFAKPGGRYAYRTSGQRCVIRAGNSTSKSSRQTDTSPEGKGEQREQPANRTDGRTTWTKLRVERQTHLPASREEAWQALQSLLPSHEWKEISAVFASLEAIYK